MNKIVIVLFFFSSLSAFAGPFSGLNLSKICKGQVISKDGYSIHCKNAAHASEVLSSKSCRKVAHINVQSYSAIEDFKVMPDADTNSIYIYRSELLNSEGNVVGYRVISGYENSEMEYKMQLTQKLNLKGALIQASIKD